MNNKNYRVMKFFEPVNNGGKSRGYVRLDIRGIKGNIIVNVENLGDIKSTSEVYLYKDRTNKIKLGDINNKKGLIKKMLTFGSNDAIEDYNICAVVKDKKIVLYTNLYNATSLEQVKKLEVSDDLKEDIKKLDNVEKVEMTSDVKQEIVKENIELPVEELTKNNEEVFEVEEEIKEVVKEVVKEEIKEDIQEEIQEEVLETKKEQHEFESTIKKETKKTSVSSAVNMNDQPEGEKEPFEDVQSQAKNRFDEGLYKVLKDYKQVEPLSVKLNNFSWWYIPYDTTGMRNGFLPYFNQIISSYYPYPMSNRVTTCSGLMKKYGHYVFGVYKENGKITSLIYGVPGEFTKEEQPYKGVTGFKNWSYSNKEKASKCGYWLAFVNPKTGDITEPPNVVS